MAARVTGALAAVAAVAAVMLADTATATNSGERALVVGEVRFGALFAVHGAPVEARAGSRCGAVREHYGIQRVEATLLALDAINADASLLQGVALGAELRDSCWAPPTALRQTIDLVRDAITPAETADDADHTRNQISANCSQGPGTLGGSRSISSGRAPLLGVLGPGASSAAMQVQNLLQLFSIPQVV
ncbi:unnamed protein product [Diatraea saccharalis]|uniref:Receptor ligand binding region domain-containing protein n=1 Tax=Diatraea saccharalis TaxID=40085 RepID=A0A9N9WEX3_9NEOP|nr:unnamed protein product [Diatraea saccharalis]